MLQYPNVLKSQMKYVGHSATNTEFQAAANALGLHIFMFNGNKWKKYSCTNTVIVNKVLRDIFKVSKWLF